jgi:hypothetical protein
MSFAIHIASAVDGIGCSALTERRVALHIIARTPSAGILRQHDQAARRPARILQPTANALGAFTIYNALGLEIRSTVNRQ